MDSPTGQCTRSLAAEAYSYFGRIKLALRPRVSSKLGTAVLCTVFFIAGEEHSGAQTLPGPATNFNIPEPVASPPGDAPMIVQDLAPPVPCDYYPTQPTYRNAPSGSDLHRAPNGVPCDQGEQPCAPPPCPPKQKSIHHLFIQQPRPASASAPQAAPQQQLPPGAFVAPPQSGAVVSEQSTVGVRGLRLRFPALTLELPSIELPSVFRRGRAAHMELDSATAAYVAGAGVSHQVAATTASYSMPSAAPAYAPAAAPAGPAQQVPQPQLQPQQPNEQLEREYAELQRRCERLEHLLMRMNAAQTKQQSLPCDQLQACPPTAVPCPPAIGLCPPAAGACPPGDSTSHVPLPRQR